MVVTLRSVGRVLEGHCFVWGDECQDLPPMHTPSPESPADLMTCVKGACDVGHRAAKALQWRRFSGVLPDANPAACLVLPQSGMGQASPTKAQSQQLSQVLNAATEPPLEQVIGLPERDLLTMNRDTRIVLFLMGELIELAVRARRDCNGGLSRQALNFASSAFIAVRPSSSFE